MNVEQLIQPFEGQVLTQAILTDLLKGYRWPHNKISELQKQGILTVLKRGLYIPGPKLNLSKPSVFLIANHIYGPSYVSMEAALSHWGLIPEKVVNIASMTVGLSKTFRTKVGLFSYTKTRIPYYSYGIRQVELSHEQTALIASPEKAICDLIATRAGVNLRSTNNVLQFLLEDLRIEKTALQELKVEDIESWTKHAPKKNSMKMLIKTLNKQ